jgi:hypothetical protein
MFENKFEIIGCKRMRIDENGLDKLGKPWGIGRKVYRVDVKMRGCVTKYRKEAKSAKHAKKIVHEDVTKLFAWLLTPNSQPNARFRRPQMGKAKVKSKFPNKNI